MGSALLYGLIVGVAVEVANEIIVCVFKRKLINCEVPLCALINKTATAK